MAEPIHVLAVEADAHPKNKKQQKISSRFHFFLGVLVPPAQLSSVGMYRKKRTNATQNHEWKGLHVRMQCSKFQWGCNGVVSLHVCFLCHNIFLYVKYIIANTY